MLQTIEVTKTSQKKTKPNHSELGFGKFFTDHMFTMDYSTDKGWHSPRITPYAPLTLEPSSMVFHYGQAVFEGLKAYRTADNRVQLFRPLKNVKRMNLSNERLSMPEIPEDLAMEALKNLIEIDKEWIPTEEGCSLYIRPFIIATDAFLGVRPSSTYKFMIILSPVGAYYNSGEQLQPVSIYVENEYVRAVRGGVGIAKTAGNYAGSLRAQTEAEKLGYDQVLWLDAIEKKYVEEVGSMNIFFKIGGKVYTPELSGSILDGITRTSVIELLEHWNIPVEQKRISVEEIFEASERGELEEIFGTGTAAVISPVGKLKWGERELTVGNGKVGQLSLDVYNTITGIQTGTVEDELNWTLKID
ncbi:branched-chain amino acid aminotransferase [Priestia filamentosa]|uniref:Branched-chain-amino-acid aminotransferase n=1 Tax=Priestia filamentosa TaxID=1402861 RepID=A0A0H4KSU6_9BACI|nr:branched-chain amino acid aminotransferase [Priestia filamentosa]AKO91378.1 branched-chain amino acid aminotransferase [Priestia filamentosa]RJS65238.1 branched-chain amino acid aminotransferase [Priestia filamentosa]WCM16559.1 branched-chain amino acid aminotransferase [Priestia filamentosa]WRU95981.1 branched-chain amino acid aminotransferase [Priestia filamentosa]